MVSINAYDFISRESMMTGFFHMEKRSSVFHSSAGSPSECLWEDNHGNVHVVPQGEGGQQKDAMMSLLFCLAQRW